MSASWNLLEKVLYILDFSPENVQKIKSDLEQMVQIEVVTSIFEDLKMEDKRKIELLVGNLTGEAAAKVINNYINELIPKSDMEALVIEVVDELTSEYLEKVIAKVKVKDKLDKINLVINEVEK
ncbi:MAG: hypothetical protein IT416_03150 [Candidatus Pacebacteria bacterium]|nr:hypothetical protein [Candidatus Paceibacterota bacterium]